MWVVVGGLGFGFIFLDKKNLHLGIVKTKECMAPENTAMEEISDKDHE